MDVEITTTTTMIMFFDENLALIGPAEDSDEKRTLAGGVEGWED
jgi:hypothetical protein